VKERTHLAARVDVHAAARHELALRDLATGPSDWRRIAAQVAPPDVDRLTDEERTEMDRDFAAAHEGERDLEAELDQDDGEDDDDQADDREEADR
jgi:hypothetical protein